MAENILKKLVNNSQIAIDDGVYDVDVNLKKSDQDFKQIIKSNPHATLLTEVKFSSPSLGKIRTIGDPCRYCKTDDCWRFKGIVHLDPTTSV